MTRRTGEDVVSYDEACQRVRAGLREAPHLQSQVADLIWPGHRMRRQGAALAAGAFTARMKADGIIRWVLRDNHSRGWVLATGPTIANKSKFPSTARPASG